MGVAIVFKKRSFDRQLREGIFLMVWVVFEC